MAKCCTKVTKRGRKKILAGSARAVNDYYDGQDGYVQVRYLGTLTLKVVGCKTKHRYIFEKDVIRKIDVRDADCLFDYHSGSFESFVEEIESAETEGDNGETEPESPTIESETSEWDGQIHEASVEGISGDSPNLEK
jgi:hypothetical protein